MSSPKNEPWICNSCGKHDNHFGWRSCNGCGKLKGWSLYIEGEVPQMKTTTINREKFGLILDKLFQEVKDLNLKKGNDYAGNEDVLKNFKVNAERIGITKEVVWAIYFNKHYDALMTFIKDGELKSEPVEGRVLDMIVYLCLFYGMLCEKKEN